MKKLILLFLILLTTNVVAQENEMADSIANPPVPQIPLDKCDSLIVSSHSDRYGVVWRDGKCGVYDISKQENVTRIEYKDLWFSFRKEIEGEYYSYFGWDEDATKGVIGVAEVNNQFITISMPKDDNNDEGKEDEK
ncbi:MAG: hypothetical protein IJ190_05455 [Prevotella sp.]|nr:hypothetical protein [Prevotella sp.]